jgi:hypothetical protein
MEMLPQKDYCVFLFLINKFYTNNGYLQAVEIKEDIRYWIGEDEKLPP